MPMLLPMRHRPPCLSLSLLSHSPIPPFTSGCIWCLFKVIIYMRERNDQKLRHGAKGSASASAPPQRGASHVAVTQELYCVNVQVLDRDPRATLLEMRDCMSLFRSARCKLEAPVKYLSSRHARPSWDISVPFVVKVIRCKIERV